MTAHKFQENKQLMEAHKANKRIPQGSRFGDDVKFTISSEQ